VPMNTRLEPELQRGLREVTAPPELWDRVQSPRTVPRGASNRGVVWAMAATVVLIAIGLSAVHRDNVGLPALTGDRCQNPAQLRAWVRAKTGLDLPLRAESSPSIQLIDARTVSGRVEIAYRAGNRDAVLLISRASAGSPEAANHAGQQFTLASNDPADLQLACKLCHLD
jgi:hypothetical protein